MTRLLFLALLLAGCAPAPTVPPEVQARGEALLLGLRAHTHQHHCREVQP